MKYLLEEENISAVFIIQSYFQVPKDVSLNCTHFFIMKFQTTESFNKSQLIICKILDLKTLLRIFYQKMYSKTILFFSD